MSNTRKNNLIFFATKLFVFLGLFAGMMMFTTEAQAQVYCDSSATSYTNQYGFCNSTLLCAPTDGTSFRCGDPAQFTCNFNNACVLPPSPALTINGSATPAPVNPGDSITVNWLLFGSNPNHTTPDHEPGIASSCTASGVTGWSGAKTFTNGFHGETITAPLTPGDYTYDLTCTGLAGDGNDTVTLTVSAPATYSVDIAANGENPQVTAIDTTDPVTITWTGNHSTPGHTIDNCHPGGAGWPGGTPDPVPSPYVVGTLAAGTHTFAMDCDVSDTFSVVYDTVFATMDVTVDSPVGGPYVLNVNASNIATPVIMASTPLGYNGSTNYSVSGISSGTSVDITAPPISNGQDFSNWTGCDSTSGSDNHICTINITSDTTITADYVPVAATCTLGPFSSEGAILTSVCQTERNSFTNFPQTCPGNPTDVVNVADWNASRAGHVGCLLVDDCNTGAPMFTYITSCASSGNNAPSAPTITGPTPTTTGTTFYTFSGSADPELDNIHYQVDWGDASATDFFPAAATLASGGSQVEGHNYATAGNYTISARAIDSNGNPSGWTTYDIEITSPGNCAWTEVGNQPELNGCCGCSSFDETDPVDPAYVGACTIGNVGATAESEFYWGGTPPCAELQTDYECQCTSNPANILTFTATPSSINLGNSTDLSWTASGDISSCALENVTDSIFISGGYSANDSQLDTPTTAGAKTYMLTCYSSSGDDTATTVVTVDPPVSSCSSGPQNSTLQFLDVGSMRADSSFIRLSVSSPGTVDPGETFTVSGWANCFGDDFSGSKGIRGYLTTPPLNYFPLTVTSVCPPGTGGSVGTRTITAPMTPGTYSQDYRVTYVEPPNVNTSEQSPQAAVTGCFEYTVSAAAATPPSVSFDANGEKTTLTVIEGTDVVLNWNVTGSATQCTAGGDWSGNPAVTGGSQSQGALPQGNYTYTLFCENGDGPSPTETVDVVVNPPAPTVDVQVSVDGGSTWSDTDQTINISQDVYISWTSTDTVPGQCVGNANVDTSGATSNAGWDAAEPTAGNSLVYRVDCTNVTGTAFEEITVDTMNPPNLRGDVIIESMVQVLDVDGNWTGEYRDVQVRLNVEEDQGVAIADTFRIVLEIDTDGDAVPNDSHTFVPDVVGAPANWVDNTTYVHTFPVTFPFSPDSIVTARIDSLDQVVETTNADNNPTAAVPNAAPAITMDLSLDPSELVRGGSNVLIDWDTNATFEMACDLTGPAIFEVHSPGSIAGLTTAPSFDPNVDGATGQAEAGPIENKSVYTLTCVEPITSTTFEESVSIETTGKIEEI